MARPAIPRRPAHQPRKSALLQRARQPIQHGGYQQKPGTPAVGAPGQPPEANPYDYSADPILQRIQALGESRFADAQAEAIRLRREAELDYGEVQQRLGRERVEKPRALTENLNQSGLFYSSHFGQEQSNLARSLLENEGVEQRKYQGRLSGIESGLLAARRSADEAGMDAEEEAAARLRERLGDLSLGRPTAPAVSGIRRAVRPPTRAVVRKPGYAGHVAPRRGIGGY